MKLRFGFVFFTFLVLGQGKKSNIPNHMFMREIQPNHHEILTEHNEIRRKFADKTFRDMEVNGQWDLYNGTINRRVRGIMQPHMEWIRMNCGVKRDKIIAKRDAAFKIYGGQLTQDFQYPWAVGIEITARVFSGPNKIGTSYSFKSCTGSLISKFHVLTAQHCFTNVWINPQTNLSEPRYGSETMFKSVITVGHGNPTLDYRHVTEEVARYIPNLDYHSDPYRTTKHDWTILELKHQVPNNLTDIKAVVPICLPARNEPFGVLDTVEAYGCGKSEPDEHGNSGPEMKCKN